MSELFQWYFETTHTTWITYIVELLYYSMWFVVLNATLPMRFKRWISILVEIILATIVFPFAAHLLPYMSVLRTVFTYALLFSFCFLIFKGSKAKVCLTLVLLQMVSVLNELIGGALYFPNEVLADSLDKLSTQELLLHTYLPYMTLSCISYLLLYLFLNRVRFSLRIRDCLLLMLYPLSQVVLISGWLKVLTYDRSTASSALFIVMVVFCLAADFALLAIIGSVARRAQLESENLLLEQQLVQQAKHYEALTAQYDSVRIMRHDISKHIDAVEGLISRGEQDEALQYIAELNQTWHKVPACFCQHPVADAFLSSQISAAEAAGIKTEFTGNIRPDIAVSSIDLIRSLGNLLENAYESCKLSQGGSVSLSCAESGGCLVIITENPAEPQPVKREKRIPSLERGIGTRVLSDIARKYDGSFSAGQDGSLYRACLVLKA